VCSIESSEPGAPAPTASRLRTIVELLNRRQLFVFASLTVARISVGLCDLAMVGAMYLLFLLIQKEPISHHFWWTPRTVLQAAGAAVLLVVARAIIDFFSIRSVFGRIQDLHAKLMLRLANGFSEMDWGRFSARNRSQLTSHALHVTREAAEFYHRCVELASGAVVVVAMTVACVYQSPLAALGFASTLGALFCVHRLIVRDQVRLAASKREASLAALERVFSDMLLSGKEIRTYRNQEFFGRRIAHIAHKFGISNRRAVLLPYVARNTADQATVLLFLGLIIFAQVHHGDSGQLLALLAFYFALSRRLLPQISQISLIAGQMESSYENVRIVSSELDECRLHRMPPPSSVSPAHGFALELDQVSFSFAGGMPFLRNICLSVRFGEMIVLHGASGQGKTSLLNMIAGVVAPLSGKVRVNRTSVAYVPQEIPLLDDTIRNNLLFGLPMKPDEALWSALAAARLDRFVAGLPRGLDTVVGDNGALISGGERQRLGLARAALRGARLLILDEATSALDETNERQILKNLAGAGAAILLVTHRRHADPLAHRVFRLQRGSLVEEQTQSPSGHSEIAPPVFEHA
jgi:ABC-type multidrug transport system fused ATPase/permease subunit